MTGAGGLHGISVQPEGVLIGAPEQILIQRSGEYRQ